MAHKKGVGSTDNGRDSNSKRLGVKLFGGQYAKAGNIIVRQRGTKFHPGDNVYKGKDFTLHAAVEGTVVYRRRQNNRTYVSVLSKEELAAASTPETPVAQPKKAAAEPVAKATAPKKEAPKAEKPKADEPAKTEEPKKAAPPKKAAAKSSKIELPSGKKIKQDDLKVVEGIGPKIAGLLNDASINTWADLANAEVDKLQAILDEAGSRYRMHDPGTWSKQAQLCVDEKWAELEEYQDHLKGGKE